jgi:hypothetical protein
MDLLGDLNFSAAPIAAPVNHVITSPQPTIDLLGDIFGGKSEPAQITAHVCYSKNDLEITLLPSKTAKGADVQVKFTTKSAISDITFQVAVPKALQLTTIRGANQITAQAPTIHTLSIENSTKIPIRLRFKIAYTSAIGTVEEQIEFSKFEPSLWQ